MHVDVMKRCTRVKAPRHTITTDVMTFETHPIYEVIKWLEQHEIWDWELIAEDDGDHGPLYVYYFVDPQDATLFSLRWS